MRKYLWIGIAALCLMTTAVGCGKKTQTEQTETTVQETTEPEQTEETTEETTKEATEEADKGEPTAAADRYHMLQGTVTELSQDGGEFTLLADTGDTYEISLSSLRDVEAELEAEAQIAIAYIGWELTGPEDLEKVELIVAFPEQEEWTICQETGTTLFNAMSSFTMKTDEGHELQLLKDNCPIEEGALSQDSGDRITVVYVTSQGMNFPIEVQKAEEEEG